MTRIEELLERAVDVPIAVDLAGDLRRGHAAVRRGRARVAGIASGLVVVAGAAVVGGHAVRGDDGRRDDSTSFATEPAEPSPSALPSQPPRPSSSPTAAPPSTPSAPTSTITADPVDPSTLVHTRFYDVPPAPDGWHLIGSMPPFVLIAPDGTDPDLKYPAFKGNLMILLGSADYPQDSGKAVAFDGRTFYHRESGARTTSISVALDDGRWLSAQYPASAGFRLADMVVFLDAVRVLPGAEGGS